MSLAGANHNSCGAFLMSAPQGRGSADGRRAPANNDSVEPLWRKQWEYAGVYADEGITGTMIERRDEFQRMI